MNRRAVVFGASGQLGMEVVRELKARNWEVAGWDRAQADITDHQAIEAALARFEPYAVFNSPLHNQVMSPRKRTTGRLPGQRPRRPHTGACLPPGRRPAHPLLHRLCVRRNRLPPLRRNRPHSPSWRLRRLQANWRTVRAGVSRFAAHRPHLRRLRPRRTTHRPRQFSRTDAAPRRVRQPHPGCRGPFCEPHLRPAARGAHH